MSTRNELTPALEAISQRLTLKQLRKRKIQAVRVVTRSGLDKVIGESGSVAPSTDSAPQDRRIQRLLKEVEKLGQAKLALEHEKGLAESERSRVQSELQAVLTACGKAGEQKVGEDDLRTMVEELTALRTNFAKASEALTATKKQLAHRERTAQSLEEKLRQRQKQNRDLNESQGRVQQERARLTAERDRYREERDQYREERDQYREERDQYRAERDRFLEERERLREQRDGHRADAESLREENDSFSGLLRQAQSALRENEAQLTQVRQAAETSGAQRDQLLGELQDTQRKLHVAREELESAFTELASSDTAKEEAEAKAEAEAEVAPEPEAKQTEEVDPPALKPTSRRSSRRGPRRPSKPAGFGFGFGGSKGMR